MFYGTLNESNITSKYGKILLLYLLIGSLWFDSQDT